MLDLSAAGNLLGFSVMGILFGGLGLFMAIEYLNRWLGYDQE